MTLRRCVIIYGTETLCNHGATMAPANGWGLLVGGWQLLKPIAHDYMLQLKK